VNTISIIGSGGMAAAIGGLAAKAGHTVEVMSRDAAKARALAEQIGAGATTGTIKAPSPKPTGPVSLSNGAAAASNPSCTTTWMPSPLYPRNDCHDEREAESSFC